MHDCRDKRIKKKKEYSKLGSNLQEEIGTSCLNSIFSISILKNNLELLYSLQWLLTACVYWTLKNVASPNWDVLKV